MTIILAIVLLLMCAPVALLVGRALWRKDNPPAEYVTSRVIFEPQPDKGNNIEMAPYADLYCQDADGAIHHERQEIRRPGEDHSGWLGRYAKWQAKGDGK